MIFCAACRTIRRLCCTKVKIGSQRLWKLLDLTSKSHFWRLNFNREKSTMVADLDEAVSIYRDLAKVPKVKLGRICTEEAPGHLQIYSEWLQRDLERNEQIKFARGHIVQLDVIIPTPPYELSNEQWNKESPSGKYRAIVRKLKDRKGDEKQFLEIWSDTRKLRNIDVLAVDRHGKIYEDDQFGCLEWSHSETHLLYVAERKVPKTKSYFDEKQETVSGSASEIEKGNEFVYKDNWGEQLSEKVHPVLCVLDIEGGCISLLENIPDNISPGQAVWCPDDLGILCVGWWHDSPRHGLIYCPMRRSALFHIDLKAFTCTILGADDRSVRSPVFSPDNSKLIYLDNQSGGPHAQCSRLILCDWPTKGIVPVVDIVRHATANEFQGIFAIKLDSKCWSLDSKRIVISTNWRSKVELVIVYVETGAVIRLTDDPKIGNWTLLEVHNDLILAACSSICQPQYLVIGHLPSSGSEKSIKWTRLDSEPTALSEISWKICPVSVPPVRVHPKYNHLDYEYIFLEPVLSDDCKPPLVVYNHGGPHAAFVAEFQVYLAGLCRCGFALLLVNYRGSYGFGEDSIDSLPGRIGSQDVLDIQSVVEEICSSGRVDADKVFIIGGSHGGFLTAHLIGQYPEFYKAAVARNPVVNIASMLGITDIPDWSFVETGLPYDPKYVPTSDIYHEMLKYSPIVNIDKIKTPLMLMLGGKDLRVPPSQGLQIKNALEGRGRTVRTLWYPDCCHPLSDVPAEADAFVNIVKWFIQHMKA